MTEPVLPYNGASSGPSASSDAMAYADTHGITAKAQQDALIALRALGAEGMTVAEFRDLSGIHHGRASGALSVLHLAGHIAMLEEKRLRCHVYVLSDYVNDRPTVEHKSNRNLVRVTTVIVPDDATLRAERIRGLKATTVLLTRTRAKTRKEAIDALRHLVQGLENNDPAMIRVWENTGVNEDS